jgi:RNA polymerase sigma-70 factor (ECF subfamily)
VSGKLGAPHASFSSIFSEYASYVIGLLRRLGVRQADVQDMAQEVFVVVHRKLDAFEGRSSVKTWLCGITAHVAANYRRRAHIRREDLASDKEPDAPRQHDPGLELDRRNVLLSALNALDPRAREVFVLHEVEELPMPEVVAIVGCPVFTGYTRLRAARKALRKQLEERGYGVDHD